MIPLSFAQQRLWFLDQLEGGGARNAPLALRLRGEVDPVALRAALGDVVDRHETLRTVFPVVDGRPWQRVLPAGTPLEMKIIPWESEYFSDLVHEMNDVAFEAFDLATEPQIRARLYALADEHVLLLVLHHIVSDGWSVGPLLRDLDTAYKARVAGGRPQWSELPVQYADYTLWQRELLGEESDPDSLISEQLRYWTTTLADAPAELQLPVDRPRPATRTYEGGLVAFKLDCVLTKGLRELAHEHEATLFMVLQAAVAALLTRNGAGTDIPLGTSIAGRTDEALDDLVGFFVNTLVLRMDTSANPTYIELVRRAKSVALGAYARQDVPFERVVEVLNPPRLRNLHPLFQANLILQSANSGTLELGGLDVTPQALTSDQAKFDLTVAFAEGPDGIDANFEYAAELFDRSTVEGLAAQLTELLEKMVAEPDSRIFPEDAFAWNDTAHPVPDVTLTALIEAGRPTVVFEGVTLTPDELHARANRLARQLIAQGVGPGERVGIAMDRSEQLIVALMGVLKAGAAYVPLDPSYPADRLAYMTEQASLKVVLTEVGDYDQPDHPLTDAERLRPLRPDDTAYVIYTSGSTGKPKGVVIQHRAIVNRLLWMQAQYGLTPDDRVAQKTPSSFDVSVWEFFWPLIVGATIVVAAPGGHRDPAYLVELFNRERVTTVHFVPSMLDVFLAVGQRCPTLRRVFASGEALSAESVTRFHRLLDCPLHNLYGPTEAAVDVTYWETVPDGGPVPIGHPVWNTTAYVLDSAMRQVPPGVAGELYLGGVQLAAGYLGRPGLTAERFVANPDGGGDRLYRTGDIARRRRDGAVEYLGRADFQVKIRGFRIELPEIEAVLASHPEVGQVAVVVHSDRLVAYVVGTVDSLREYAASQLPAHMVPSFFVRLPELPLTPNGKLDRRALPAPVAVSQGRPPSTEPEHVLCGLFAEVLGLDEVTVDDDFFALGGHSLLVIRLLARAADAGISLSVRDVFDRPTVAGLLSGSSSEVDLAAEVRLDLPIQMPREIAPMKRVLLTGATGFLGSFLLQELLERTDAQIYCLVRNVAKLPVHPRIVPVFGDLAGPELDIADFDELASTVDTIFHNGAKVNHLDPYQRLKAANVDGTREILRLATTARLKPVHFVSSISVAVAMGENPAVIDEDTRVPGDRVVPSGYVASKWVAEELVRAASKAGVPVAIYRPGRISGHSVTGAGGTEDDSFWGYVRAMTRLGGYVVSDGALEVGIDLVPVDHVAGGIVALALGHGAAGQTYHLVGGEPVPVGAIVTGLRARGYTLEAVNAPEWDARVADAAAGGDRTWAAAALLGAGFRAPSHGLRWGNAATLAALGSLRVAEGSVTAATIARYIDHFVANGFFTPPPTDRS